MSVSKVLSIEITDVCTRACLMDYHKKQPVIYRSTIFENPEGTVEDGFVVERGAYEEVLRKQLKAAKMMYPDVIFSVASNRILTRETAVPDLKEEKITELIQNERSTYFPIDTGDHMFAFDVLEKIKDEKKLRIIIYAMPRQIILNIKAICAEMGFNLVSVGYTGNSVMRYLMKPDTGMDLYLQINEKNTLFTILNEGRFALQRNMNFGTEVYDGTKTVRDATRPLIANLGSVLEYYTSRNKDINVSRIYLGGIGSHVTGIKSVIENEFNGIEVVMVDELPGIKIKENNLVCANRSTEFVSCIGVCDSNINFFIEVKEKSHNKTLRLCVMGFAVVLAASVVIVLNGKAKYDDAVARNERLTKELKALTDQNISRTEDETIDKLMLLFEVQKMDDNTFSNQDNWPEIVKTLEENGVRKMVVTSANSTGNSLMLNIIVGTKLEAAKVILQLKEMECFSEIVVNGVAIGGNEEDGTETASFTAMCRYNEDYRLTDEEYMKKIVEEFGLTDLNRIDVLERMEAYRQ